MSATATMQKAPSTMQSAVYTPPATGPWVDPKLCAVYGDTSQACVSQEVAEQCTALAKWGCTELIIAESCPVQLSCAKTACPTSEPTSGSACSAPGLSCTLKTWTCPGTTEPITSSWAECFESNEWQIGMAGIHCPDPPALRGWHIAVIVAASAAAAFLIAAVVLCIIRRKRNQPKAVQKTQAPSVSTSA